MRQKRPRISMEQQCAALGGTLVRKIKTQVYSVYGVDAEALLWLVVIRMTIANDYYAIYFTLLELLHLIYICPYLIL